MLPIPVEFFDKQVHAYQQTCKRAENYLSYLSNKRYVLTEKLSWWRTRQWEVNAFGEMMHVVGSLDNATEWLLQEDKISPLDYQLLKFYEYSDVVDALLEVLKSREENQVIPVSLEEFQVLMDISSFEEDPELTKEDILEIGKQL